MTILELLNIINSNPAVHEIFDTYCDVIFKDAISDDSDLRDEIPDTRWNVEWDGVFATDASGGEFIRLADESVGFTSSEGEADRIAECADDFLRLLIFCPFWCDLTGVRSLSWLDDKAGFCDESEKEYSENYPDFSQKQKTLAAAFGITDVPSAFECADKMYAAAIRDPRFFGLFHDDGEEYTTDSLFDLQACAE